MNENTPPKRNSSQSSPTRSSSSSRPNSRPPHRDCGRRLPKSATLRHVAPTAPRFHHGRLVQTKVQVGLDRLHPMEGPGIFRTGQRLRRLLAISPRRDGSTMAPTRHRTGSLVSSPAQGGWRNVRFSTDHQRCLGSGACSARNDRSHGFPRSPNSPRLLGCRVTFRRPNALAPNETRGPGSRRTNGRRPGHAAAQRAATRRHASDGRSDRLAHCLFVPPLTPTGLALRIAHSWMVDSRQGRKSSRSESPAGV